MDILTNSFPYTTVLWLGKVVWKFLLGTLCMWSKPSGILVTWESVSDEILLGALDLDVYALFYSMVITELPADQAKLALEKLCLPVVTPLQVRLVCFWWIFFSELLLFHNTKQVYNVNNQEIISQGPDVLEKKLARELTVHIDRLAYIFRFDWHSQFIF